MSEYLDRQLPQDISEADLRFKRILPDRPAEFDDLARLHGWDLHLDEQADDHACRAQYVLAHEISADFDDAEAYDLVHRLGMVDDDGDFIEGYSLWSERIGDQYEHDEDFPLRFIVETNRLFFEFRGFPNDKTMDVLEGLVTSFPAQTRWYRMLGHFALKNLNQPGQ